MRFCFGARPGSVLPQMARGARFAGQTDHITPDPTASAISHAYPHSFYSFVSMQILGVDNNEGYEILEEEDPDDYSMPASASSSLSSASSASYLTAPTMSSLSGDDSQPLSSLALLRSIIYIRRAKEVSAAFRSKLNN